MVAVLRSNSKVRTDSEDTDAIELRLEVTREPGSDIEPKAILERAFDRK